VVTTEQQLKYVYWIVLALVTITFLSGINLPVLGVDASQYASISMEMLENGSYLEVFHRGRDYLDKPPLLFWLSSFSFSIFGIENWAYRLPSILFIYLGIYSTLRLGRLLYNKTTGYVAAIIFATTQSIFIISHDVRTDTILVGAAIFSVWGIVAFLENGKFKHLILGFIGVGLAMLVKGPIGLMVPVLAIGTHILIKRQWSNLFRWEWLVGIVITAIVISPMIYGLYSQFDAQPEKLTSLSSGKVVEGISGLNFYFWEQSFGRLTGESEWDNGAPWHFFLGIFSWSYLPWTFIAALALIYKVRTSFKAIKVSEFYTIGAIFLPFIALSFSKFQLDHYIYIIYPFIAILAGNYLNQLAQKSKGKFLIWIQIGIMLILFTAIILIGQFVFVNNNILYYLTLGVIIVFMVALIIKRRQLHIVILASAIAACMLNIYLKTHFFPNLAEYDAQLVATRYVEEANIPKEKQHVIGISPHSFDFHSRHMTSPVYNFTNLKTSDLEGSSILFSDKHYRYYEVEKMPCKKAYKIAFHSPTRLNMRFLNPETRDESLEYIYLVFF
jgi:4-amino-4-deoxy-L-arabinose transferase-like glycosyltransferase